MTKPVFAALLCIGLSAMAAPLFAQDSQPAADTAAPAPKMTPDQITAFNQAVADFTAAQQLQQKGDNAGAIAKYEAALPAIRTAVQVEPANQDYSRFLANALYATAAAQAGARNFDAVISLYKEAVPLWRGIVAANPADAASRNILAGMLVQLGNKALGDKDKETAKGYYTEATGLARQSVTAAPNDRITKNLLLSALIGLSQTSDDKAVMNEAITMGKTMMTDGSIDAVNKPSIEIMTGAKS